MAPTLAPHPAPKPGAGSSCLANDDATRKLFREQFDIAPFEFSHQIHRSGLFSEEALLALIQRVALKSNRFYIEQGETTPQKGWNPGSNQTLIDAYRDIASNHSLVMLKRVNEDPEYAPVLDTLKREMSDHLGIDMQKRYRDGLMTLLITSPHRITPYHIDGEANLLMQMVGTKSVYIFDGENRSVLPEHELERFWSGNVKATVYKQDFQAGAKHFKLIPGLGVTNPVTFPHWVQNGPEVSVSMSVNFKRIVDTRADAYRINHQLRRFGLSPKEPGKGKLVDSTKSIAYRAVRRIKQYVSPPPGK
jgi:hypothetical protein